MIKGPNLCGPNSFRMTHGSITWTNLGAQEWCDSPRSQSRQGSQSTERSPGKCKMLLLFLFAPVAYVPFLAS